MTLVKNAAPQLALQGFDDKSTRILAPQARPTPIHMPLFFTYAERGLTVPQIVSGSALVAAYGSKTFDYRSAYCTHVTPFINVANENANAMMVQRILGAGAAVASISIGLDILAKTVPLYQRTASGDYARDVDGDLIPTGSTTLGFVAKWVITGNAGAPGSKTVTAGGMSDGGTQSQIYPVMDLRVATHGAYGNDIGLRLWAPTTRSLEPIDEELALEQQAYLFRMQVAERADARSTPLTTKALSGDPYVQFSFKPGSVNTRADSELHADRVLLSSYRDMNNMDRGVPAYGPFDTVHVYQANVEALNAMVFAKEQPLNSELPAGAENSFLVNLFSATNLDGTPYHSLILQGSLESAPELVENATYYCAGGADGAMNDQAYNEAVRAIMDNLDGGSVDWSDMARYPFSAFYDSGFDLVTKKSIGKWLGVRRDVHVADATQDVNAPTMSLSEESSALIALRASLRLIPESVIYGTPCARAVVMTGCGEMINSTYGKKVPMTLELLAKRAKYLGASNGAMISSMSYDEAPNNRVQYVKNLNNASRPADTKSKDWSAGGIWAQYYDTETLFIPAFQTVYDDDTSVLNSDLNMQIACHLNRVCFNVWRNLVGNTKLTREQFIERSNQAIIDETKDRYDNRVRIVPETKFTAADDKAGYSWTANIHMYGNVMRTVQMSTIVTHRLEELN